jgi:transcriptional regulator with GAF, ATPase, and Fis domain
MQESEKRKYLSVRENLCMVSARRVPDRDPALRERGEDIPALAAHFAGSAGKRIGVARHQSAHPAFTNAQAWHSLASLPWRGLNGSSH